MYDHKSIEKKWQERWLTKKPYQAKDNDSRPKFYCLDMFPYPSGAGLHVGHPKGYTATDIYSRYKRMNGFNVLHPMGWDAFGLPAENYAIKVGVPPAQSTAKNIATFKRQIQELGLGYDWDREVDTSKPEYYKWTQWLFFQLYKHGLAYRGKAPVNWCESCQTVLANEQVEDGHCERCKNDVVQKELEQWFFKITAYAEELLNELHDLDWPDSIKQMQTNWIGKSTGGEISFAIITAEGVKTGQSVKVFTTRPDTLYGATYLVLAPEHELVAKISLTERLPDIRAYQDQARRKSERERTDLARNKTGVPIGAFAINPVNNETIPVWIADYVLPSYGTGAIMAVPAHDIRDFEFAAKYRLPIREVVKPASGDTFRDQAYTGDGVMINSGDFDGQANTLAGVKILKRAGGTAVTKYRLRDWLVSRQRYWGSPIPIIYCPVCGPVPVPEAQLPVFLPDDVDFRPTGESPLARSVKFNQVSCPKCGAPGRRESDTMDTFVCSSWYFLRFGDPLNKHEAFGAKNIKYWMPVDLYIGGAEHAVGHLMFARFFMKFLRDAKFLNFGEPFLKLVNIGLVLAEDGRKMSKSLGNVVNPDDVVAEYGADTLRMYEMFMGPLTDAIAWSTQSIKGVSRFLNSVHDWVGRVKPNDSAATRQDLVSLHKLIKKVTEDIESLHFNTAVSAFMIFLNEWEKRESASAEVIETFLKLLSPFAPHLAEEMWSRRGHDDLVCSQAWPKFSADLVHDAEKTLVVQVNGKVRDRLTVKADIDKEAAIKVAKQQPKIASLLVGKNIKQEVFVPGKLVNFVVE